jgi:SAM-dependent methyltransferase
MACHALVAALLATGAVSAFAQARPAEKPFVPQVGQQGKDVIWVPTPDAVVERMLGMAGCRSGDFVIDLGSGDGRIAIAAAKKCGARAMGIEYNPDMVAVSNDAARREGVADRVRFVKADIFAADFSQATIVTMYLLPDLNIRLRPKILGMKPGTRVTSHQFTMGEWEADEVANVDGRTAYFWIVPAPVGGAWDLLQEGAASVLTLRQEFQMLQGSAVAGGSTAQVKAGSRMRGDAVAFTLVDASGVERTYAGRVEGGAMTGTVRAPGGAEQAWSARRRP